MATTKRQRGFTLIELMVTVAIVGILSSVAIPNFTRASLRARKAERDMVLDAVSRGTQSLLIRNGKFPSPFVGAWNPATPVTSQKRRFDMGADGWRDIDLQIEGWLYHSYRFFVTENASAPWTLDILAQGDLDGDADFADRRVQYELRDGALWVKTDDQDDESVF